MYSKDAKETWVQSQLGDGPEARNGPVGLRNLGATCYVRYAAFLVQADHPHQANAFLQLWYHNVAFRNGLYRCHLSEVSLSSCMGIYLTEADIRTVQSRPYLCSATALGTEHCRPNAAHPSSEAQHE